MEEDHKSLSYGYGLMKYVSVVLLGGGFAGAAAAIVFTVLAYPTWVLVACWVFGAVLFVSGLFWHLAMGFMNDPAKLKLFHENFTGLLRAMWDGTGRVLDIGTGSGRSAVEVARRFGQAQVIGVDTWGKFWAFWGQTKQSAEKNARAAKVSGRCTFRRGSALDLPFEADQFQLVVSTFAFHEVRLPGKTSRVSDRTVLLEEAVRVLAPGGILFICDQFPNGYGVENAAELVKKAGQLGLTDVKCRPIKETGLDPGGLAHIWGMAYLSGKKA